MRTLIALVVLALGLSVASAADDTQPAYRLLTLAPQAPGSAIQGAVLREAAPGDLAELRQAIAGSAAIQDTLRNYHETRKAMGRPYRPLILVADEATPISYAAIWPHFLVTEDGAAPTVLVEPIIHLSRESMDSLIQEGAGSYGEGTIPHETGHAIMIETHGVLDYPDVVPESVGMFLAKEYHWLGKETDSDFAWSEGWAEFVGSYALGEPFKKKYIQDKNGDPMSGEELRTHEAAVQMTLLAVSRAGIYEDPMATYLEVMRTKRPRNLESFLDGLAELRPEKKQALQKVLRETTAGELPLKQPIPFGADGVRQFNRLVERSRTFLSKSELAHKLVDSMNRASQAFQAVLGNMTTYLRGLGIPLPGTAQPQAAAGTSSAGSSHGASGSWDPAREDSGPHSGRAATAGAR